MTDQLDIQSHLEQHAVNTRAAEIHDTIAVWQPAPTPPQGAEVCPSTGTTFIGPKKWHRCNNCTLTINSNKPISRHHRPKETP